MSPIHRARLIRLAGLFMLRIAKQTTKNHNKLRSTPEKLWRKQLYERYSHLGKRNFVRYGLRAAEMMESRAMLRQLRPLWHRLASRILKADTKL